MLSLKDRLIEILIKNKLLTQEQLAKALEEQKRKGGRLSDIIIRLEFIKEKELAAVLSEGLGLPLIDLKRFKIDPEITRIVSSDIARHYQMIPVSKIADALTLAMADPLNIFAIDYLKGLTGYRINPIIASSQDINQAIELYYPDTARGAIDDLVKEISGPAIEVIKQDKQAAPSEQELSRISHQGPVVQIVNMVLEQAVKKRASDVLIEPFEKLLRMRYRVDGILHEEEPLPHRMYMSIVSRIKVISELNIAECRLPQDGRFKVRISGREVDFRVSILPSVFGEKVALRILDKTQALLDVGKLGFSEDVAAELKKAAMMPHGMILVCGPTGSGKTTTLYSLLKFVDSPEKNIITVEDPVEYQLEGINQVTAKPEIGLSFASALRSILRQDPDIIMIGEIRDYDTVDIAVKSALTGHLVLSTLHTTTAAGSIARLLNMGVEPYLINSSVISVVAQRLLRRICPHCKEEYAPSPEILKNISFLNEPRTTPCLPADRNHEQQTMVFYKAKGCQRCLNTGYLGRIGIAEVLMLTSVLKEIILSQAQEHVIKRQARQEGMKTLREAGLEAVSRGETTIEEVMRVTAADEYAVTKR